MRRGVEWLVQQSAAGRKLVRPLGRGLHLRHLFRAARPGRVGRKRPRSPHPARRRVASLHSERRRRLGRKLRQLRQRYVSLPRPSTPSQTAWAILGLIAGGDANSLSVQHGIEYLLETQRPDGSWDEELGHRDRLSQSFLSELPPVQGLFPAARAGFVREGPTRTRMDRL